MPREPPINSARPKSPLWLSGFRGGKQGKEESDIAKSLSIGGRSRPN
jgi:hypothetical protein